MHKIGLTGCALAILAASSTASAQFTDCTSARNSGFNLTQFYVSAVMNTVGCDGSSERLASAEELLQRLLGGFELPQSMAVDLKVCYISGFQEGYQSTLLSEYDDCDAIASAASIGRANGAVASFALAELGDELGRAELAAIFEGGKSFRDLSGQLECRQGMLAPVGGVTASDDLFDAAILACGGAN